MSGSVGWSSRLIARRRSFLDETWRRSERQLALHDVVFVGIFTARLVCAPGFLSFLLFRKLLRRCGYLATAWNSRHFWALPPTKDLLGPLFFSLLHRRNHSGDRFCRTVSATRKSAQTDVISQGQK
jgi:hypothetical protein